MRDPSRRRDDRFYRSADWFALRRLVLQRDLFRCVICGADVSASGAARIDHIKPRSTHPELERDLDNLRTLCASCDNRSHGEKLHPTRTGERVERFKPAIGVDGWPIDK